MHLATKVKDVMQRLIRSLLDPQAKGAADRWQALTAIAWGAWLLMPFASFALPTGIYDHLFLFGSETAWGLGALAAGSLALIASYNGPGLRLVVNVWMTLWWAFLALAVTVAVPPATLGVLLAMLALRQMTLTWDSCIEYRAERWTTSRTT